jgi:hypothetical protein
MAWYRTGTVTVNNSTTVTGSPGTEWLANVKPGDMFLANGVGYEVTAVLSNTSLTLGSTFSGSISGAAYAIAPVQGYIKSLATDVGTLVANYSGIYNSVGAGKFQDGAVGTPSISFVSDTNSGIYRSAADTYHFVANGASQCEVSVNGLKIQDGKFSLTGSADTTKIVKFEVDGLTTGTTRTLEVYDLDGPIGIVGTNTLNSPRHADLGSAAYMDHEGLVKTAAPVTVTAATYTVTTATWIIVNFNGTCTLTLPNPALFPGRCITIKTIQAQLVSSASSNVEPIGSATPGTAILAATVGKWARLVSDGIDWIVMEGN